MKTIKKLFILLFLGTILITSCQRQPVACFSSSSLQIKAGESVTFTNCSTDGYTYEWYVDNKFMSDTDGLTVDFSTGGAFVVKLLVFSKNGKKIDEISETISVLTLKSVTISKIVLTKFPATTSSGGGWDLTSGPDVFVRVEDGSTIIFEDPLGSFIDVLTTDLPLSFASTNASVTTPTKEITARVYDYDTADPDDYMGGINFTPSSFSKGSPATIVLDAGGNVAMTLHVTWNY